MDACGADTLANELQTSLIAGESFDLPIVDLNNPEFAQPVGDGGIAPPVKLTIEDLTTRKPNGEGVFDALMESTKAHLRQEYEANRISGAEYTKAYIALTEAAISGGIQFLLGRDQAYWQAVAAQLQAQVARVAIVTAKVQLETAKVDLQRTRIETMKSKADYALTKMKIATESAAYCIAKFNLENILPVNLIMLNEQVEAARAQTMDTRRDGTPITGTLGKQIKLYGQQIISYRRDSEMKGAKMFADAWTVQKTVDEGLIAPAGFTNANVDEILSAVKDRLFTNPEAP